MLAVTPPYALASTSFRFAALASLAGRAPLGGQREVALAVYVVARLAHDALPEQSVSGAARRERAVGARQWLSTLVLPTATLRASLTKLIDASMNGANDAAAALTSVIAATTAHLDPGARRELDRLVSALALAPAAPQPQALVE